MTGISAAAEVPCAVCGSSVRAARRSFRQQSRESPGSVAYDTPSPKLLSFLQKHYGESGPGCRHCLMQASAFGSVLPQSIIRVL